MLSAEAVVVKLKNLSSNIRSMDIRKYFGQIHIPDGGVLVSEGEAFIKFREEDAARAMAQNNGWIRGSKVQMVLSTKKEMDEAFSKSRPCDNQSSSSASKSASDPRQYSQTGKSELVSRLTTFIDDSAHNQQQQQWNDPTADFKPPPTRNSDEVMEFLRKMQSEAGDNGESSVEPYLYLELKYRDLRFKLSAYNAVKKVLTPLCNREICLGDLKKINDREGNFSGRMLFRTPGNVLSETDRIIREIKRLIRENEGVSRAAPEVQITDVGASSHYEFENHADAYSPMNTPKAEYVVRIDKLPANFSSTNVSDLLRGLRLNPTTQISRTRPDFMDSCSFLVYLNNHRDVERALFYNDEFVEAQRIAVIALSKDQAKYLSKQQDYMAAVVGGGQSRQTTRFNDVSAEPQRKPPLFPFPPPPPSAAQPRQTDSVKPKASRFNRRPSPATNSPPRQDRKRSGPPIPFPRKFPNDEPPRYSSSRPLIHPNPYSTNNQDSPYNQPPPPQLRQPNPSAIRPDNNLPPIPSELQTYRGRILLLNNIPYRAEKTEICNWLADFGPVEQTLKISHDQSGKPTGHAIVACESSDGARQARATLSGTSFCGRYVNIVLV